ncbi:MAG: hypothetical protein JNM27_01890 [Leptospirales bacterium]|nr:hypothetical protein [Leptospirales bacterium]
MLALLLPVSLSLAQCARPKSPLRISYYYWQTTIDWKTSDSQFLKETETDRLYLRLFDVNTEKGQAVPLARLRVTRLPEQIEVVPVIYIRNEVIASLDPLKTQELSNNIIQQTNALLPRGFPEIQVDCDWTHSTRDRYFRLLRMMRSDLPPNVFLSATIRLHQLKYRTQTGVPPVERGALMFYGTGQPSEPSERNSILDLNTAQSYLASLGEYPLPLDAALPVYSWGVLFHGQKFRGILRDVTPEMLEEDLSRSGNVYRARKPVRLRGMALAAGDWIRLDSVDPEVSAQALKMLLPGLRLDSRVILFHYHEGLTKYGSKKILSIADGGRALLEPR